MRASAPKDNRSRVLAALGRASTPPVPERAEGPSLFELMTAAVPEAQPRIISVVTPVLRAEIRRILPEVTGTPGVLPTVAEIPSVSTFVVESAALFQGPWMGADSHQSKHLAEEIFEAGRILRARGGQVLLVHNVRLTGSMAKRLLSTFTVDLSDIPPAELEEGARQSPLWDLLVTHTRNTIRRS